MVDLNVGCLTCLQPSYLNVQHVQTSASIQRALQKHFWFTEADLQQAIMCQSCWEQVNNFNRFYISVEELYQNQRRCVIDVKLEPETEEFDHLEEVRPECSSFKMEVETEQLNCFNSEYSVLSVSKHELIEDKDVAANADDDIGADEPFIEPLLKKNSDQDIPKRKRVRQFLSEDDRIKKHVKYICEECGHESETFCLFTEHALHQHHNKTPFLVCCGKQFKERKSLFQHVRRLINRDIYRCRQCQKTFKGRRAYRCHRNLCHGSGSGYRIFDCDQCPRSFSVQHTFKAHTDKHTGIWNCEECNKNFINDIRLKEHVTQAHPELPLLTCDVCPEMFHLNSLMQLHNQTHTQQQCQLCPRMPQDKKSLRAHARTMHPDAMVCSTCKKVLPTKVALQAHKVQAHGSRGTNDDYRSLSLEAGDSDVLPERSHGRTLDVEKVELNQTLRVALTDCLMEGLTVCPSQIVDVETLLISTVVKKEPVIEDPNEDIVEHEMEQNPKGLKRNDTSSKRTSSSSDAYIRKHVKLICDKCGQESLTFKLFMTHALEKHNDQLAFVACCGRKFRSKCALFQHVQTKNNPNMFRCEDCKISFHSSTTFRRHQRNAHGEKKIKCDYCCKSFASETVFWSHRKDHLPEQNIKCPLCGKLFQTRRSVNWHLKQQHSDLPQFICDVCSKKFIIESWLLEHKKRHKELQCLFCPQRLPFARDLRKHVLKHHPGVEFPVICSICRDVLPTKDALDAHKAQNHMRLTMFTEEEGHGQYELESSIDVKEEQVIEEQSEMIVQQIEEQNGSENTEDEMENEDLAESELSAPQQNSRSTELTVKRYQDGKRLPDHVSELPSCFALEDLRT